MPPGEENKFVLLVKEEDDIYSDHNCIGWVDAGPGSFIDLNERPEFNQIPSQIENFMGRNEVMHDLLCLILTSRFVTLKGIAGIGKSSLAKETIRYIYERKHFRNGVIYINMNGCESREAVMGSLNARIYGSHQYVESRKENGGKMVQQIVEHLRDKEALIVFDNVMDLMLVNEKEKEKFQLFIDLLLSNCNDIKVLITSRTPLGDGPLADYAEKIINLGPLIEEDSKNLLLARAPRIIDNEEIDELMNLEINVNYGIPQDKKKEFVGHAFFDLFGGHPQAITLAASLLDEKRLKEVFLHLEENSVIHVYDYGSEVSERDKKSFNSLRCSLDISWESLSKKNANAARLLSFLGLFPAGIQEEELEILWEKNFKLECEVLLRSSFLRKTHKDSTIHYSLFPFMAKYAEEHLSQIEKRDHHEKILQHFAKSIEEYYKTIGTISKNAEKSLNELIRYELNIRACIFREISYQGNEDLEKSLYDSFNLNTSNIRINERFKDIEAIKEDEEDEFFPLTKTNIQMHQKRFDMNKGSLKQNPSLSIHSIRSSSPIYITENMANQLKTPKAKTGVWENNFYNYNVSQSENFMIKAFAFNEGGANSASLESRNNCELIDAIDRYSSTPEPEMLRIGGDLYKISRPTIKNNVCLNSDMLLCLEKKDSQSKNTPKFFKNKDNNNLLEEKDESPLMFDNYSKETEKKVVKILLENTPIEKSTSIKEPQPVKINSSYNEVTARFSKDSFGSVNNSQEIYANMKSGSKNYHQKSNYIKKSNSGLSYSGQVLPINRLIIYYVSILFLLRRYVEAIKMLKYGLRIADINNDILAKANYYRILGVVGHLKKHYTKSLEDFQRARDLFSRVNCYIGVAISEAAMGYVKFSENSQLSQAKEHLEKSLKLYEQLEHSFGIHFLNKWLGSLKKKIPHLKHQSKLHFHEMNKIKDIKKDECIISTHKGGFFVLRWMGDPISLLLEAPLNASLKKKSTKDSFNNEKVKKTEDISDNEIKSLSKNMKLKIDSSIDLENNSATLDDSSNNKTPLDILRNNFFQEGDEILTNIPLFGSFSKETSFPINQSNNSNKKVKEGKPPQKPKTTNVGKNNKQS